MDRNEKALLLLDINDTAKKERDLIVRIEQYITSCENVKKALRLLLSHVNLVPHHYAGLDKDVLILPSMSTQNTIEWDRLTDLRPNSELSGIIASAIELRDTRADLQEMRRRFQQSEQVK